MIDNSVNLDRAEYGKICHQVFARAVSREACRDGWRRWQEVRAARTKPLAGWRPPPH